MDCSGNNTFAGHLEVFDKKLVAVLRLTSKLASFSSNFLQCIYCERNKSVTELLFSQHQDAINREKYEVG